MIGQTIPGAAFTLPATSLSLKLDGFTVRCWEIGFSSTSVCIAPHHGRQRFRGRTRQPQMKRAASLR